MKLHTVDMDVDEDTTANANANASANDDTNANANANAHNDPQMDRYADETGRIADRRPPNDDNNEGNANGFSTSTSNSNANSNANANANANAEEANEDGDVLRILNEAHEREEERNHILIQKRIAMLEKVCHCVWAGWLQQRLSLLL